MRQRVATNRATLAASLGDLDAAMVGTAAGWYGVIAVGQGLNEERFVLELLREEKVLLHPGFYYDFPEAGYLELSLLGDPDEFREGVARLAPGLRQAPRERPLAS